MSITQILWTVINREYLPHAIYGKAYPATTSYQQDSCVRSPPSRLKANNPILVKGGRRAGDRHAERATVDLVNDGLGWYRLGLEGRLVVPVHQARP